MLKIPTYFSKNKHLKIHSPSIKRQAFIDNFYPKTKKKVENESRKYSNKKPIDFTHQPASLC